MAIGVPARIEHQGLEDLGPGEGPVRARVIAEAVARSRSGRSASRAGVAAVCSTTAAQMGPVEAPLAIPADLSAQIVQVSVERGLEDASLRANVRRVQAEIAGMPSPDAPASTVEGVTSERGRGRGRGEVLAPKL